MTDPETPETPGSPQESKSDKFKRLAESRTTNALAKIKLIGNLASSDYEFNTQQIEKVLAGLREAVTEVEKKFQKGLNRQGFNDEGKFRL